MILAITKKANQGEQQNQTTISTNFNYIQNFISIFFFKKNKLINKVKRLSDKTETQPMIIVLY